MKKPSQRKAFATHGWTLKMLEKENFILLYRTRIPVVSHSLYLKNTLWSQRYSFTPETVPCPSALRFRDWERFCTGKLFSGRIPVFPGRMLLLHWPETGSYHNHCSIPEKEIPFPACKRLCGDLKRICYFPIGFKGQRYIKNNLNKMIYLIFFLYRSMRRMPL